MGEEDITPSLERERVVETAWIFDIDGVVTNPQEKKVTEPQILVHIADKLKKGDPVAFNTGRSSSWLIERVISPLLGMIEDRSVLQNFIAVGEKGGTWLTFDRDGTIQPHKDDSITVHGPLKQKVEELVKTKFAQSMFYDGTKETMISTEMQDGYDIEEYKKDQAILREDLTRLVKEEDQQNQLKVDPTTIATDIENKHVGKGFATERILDLLKQKGIKPKQFIAFGDSPSDIAMAEKLHESNLTFTFIFVDDKGRLKGVEYPFPIVYTKNRFDKGTLQFLREHSGGL